MAKLSPQFPSVRTILVTIGIAAVSAAVTSLSHPAVLSVDGQNMISDVPPVTTVKGAYVPLRAVAELLGADTNYDAKTGGIELVRAGDTLRFRVGDRVATLNGMPMTLKQAPFAVRGRTMVSLPYSWHINDKPAYEHQHCTADDFSNMICRQFDRKNSIRTRLPAMNPPMLASDLEKLPAITSTRPVNP